MFVLLLALCGARCVAVESVRPICGGLGLGGLVVGASFYTSLVCRICSVFVICVLSVCCNFMYSRW
jgi:hypothetical protein